MGGLLMKEHDVLKEIGFILIAAFLLSIAFVMDKQLYLMRLEAGRTFVFQPVFLLMSVSRLITAVLLLAFIWLILMKQQGQLIFSLFCIVVGMIIVFYNPLTTIMQLSMNIVFYGNSRFSEVGAMLTVIGVWRLGQLFLRRRRVAI